MTCPHLFFKIFVDFLTSTLLRAQNTTLLSKVQIFMAFSENPNFNKKNRNHYLDYVVVVVLVVAVDTVHSECDP
jgi:hypothetical protein